MAEIFRRIEKKYILTKEQYLKLQNSIKDYMIEDEYGPSTICNIYFDSSQYDLISHSIEKPFFKEKVRLRSYNVPTKDSKVFLEIKRKYDGVVGKRRIEMKLDDFNKYINDVNSLKSSNHQIKSEIDYYFKIYNLKPTMYISYSRVAYYQKDNPDFRLTFDNNVVAREYDLDLTKGKFGNNILEEDKYIMEIKTLNSIPLWLVNYLNELKIVPGSFSKYGTAYEDIVLQQVPVTPRYKFNENNISIAHKKAMAI